MKYTVNKEHKTTVNKLYKELTSGDIALLGMSYESDYFPSGVLVHPTMKDINIDEEGNLTFINEIEVVESMKPAVVGWNNTLSESGLGIVRTEQLQNQLKETGLLTDLLAKGTNLTSTKRVEVFTTFIDPEVSYSNITLVKDIKLKLYRIVEQSPLNGYTHDVYLLTSSKDYDGQTLLGMLQNKNKISKVDTEKVLDLFKGHSLMSRNVFSVQLDNDSYKNVLYNTHETGIFFLNSVGTYTIACGQSYLRVPSQYVKSSVVEKEGQFTVLKVNLKGEGTLKILMG